MATDTRQDLLTRATNAARLAQTLTADYQRPTPEWVTAMAQVSLAWTALADHLQAEEHYQNGTS